MVIQNNKTLNNYRQNEANSSHVHNSTNENFFLNKGVVSGCGSPIEIRFETLIEAHCERPYDWYQDLELDKGNASRIRRGLVIPQEWLRIKIAQYFKTDSSTIWKVPDIISADKLKKEVAGIKTLTLPNSKLNEGDNHENN